MMMMMGRKEVARGVGPRIHDMIGGCCLRGWICFRDGIDGARFGMGNSEVEGRICRRIEHKSCIES